MTNLCHNCECPPGHCEDEQRYLDALEDADIDDKDRAEAEEA